MTSYDIPYWKKYTLSIEEAASYFRIGEGKLRKLVVTIQMQSICFGMGIVYR